MNKILLQLARIALALSWAGVAQASQGYYQGYVTDVMASGGIILVTLTNGSGQLSCGTTAQFWVDPSTAFGQSQISLAVTAKATGTLVYVQGNGTCSTAWPYNNTEQLATLDWKG